MNNENELNENAAINGDGDSNFQPPDGSDGSGGSGESPSQAGEYDLPPHALAIENSDDSTNPEISEVKTQIENGLSEAANLRVASVANAKNVSGPGVIGVGVSAKLPGQSILTVYVEEDGNEDLVRRELFDNLKIQGINNDNFPINVVCTGPIDALSNRRRFRPAPAGVSVGHFRITAGTIGGWSRGNDARSRRLLMISNNHVLADSNSGRFGDSILQPGPADGGRNPQDRIAILERYYPIRFGGPVNFVDCATGWCWPNLVRTDHVYHDGSTPRYFKIGTDIMEPQSTMLVGKTGRTTNLTQGLVQATGVSINVNFGSAGVAHFRDQSRFSPPARPIFLKEEIPVRSCGIGQMDWLLLGCCSQAGAASHSAIDFPESFELWMCL